MQEIFLQRLRFLHIPKTAGTTFTQVLNNEFRDKIKFQFTGDIKSDVIRLNSLSTDEQNSITLYTGHAPILTGIKHVDSIRTITFLREPVDRVKSFCQHVSEGKSAYLKRSFPPENFNLDKFLNTKEVFELHNLQIKMLVNKGACSVDFNMTPSEALTVALDNLFNKISAFGLVEYFDESLMLFKQKFNWELPIYKITNTKNMDKLIEFKPHHIERIKQINSLDIELYQQAQEKFIELISAEKFNKKVLLRFQKINKNKKLSLKKYRDNVNGILAKIYNKLLNRS